MTNNKMLELNIEQLNEEYDMLKEELTSLDSLYNEAKEKLDGNSKYPTKMNFVFVSNQTSNLISIKEKRLNIIKELTNIKKTKMEMEMKLFQTNNKIEDGETSSSLEAREIFNLIQGINRKELMEDIKNTEEKVMEEEFKKDNSKDDELEKVLEERIKEENRKKDEKNNKKSIELPNDLRLVVDKDKNIYVIDSDYNLLEDEEYNKYKENIVIIDFETINDEEFAIDNDGNKYEVIEFE